MARCLIHIGMHRTGSTSIQRSLAGFADANFSYAQLGPKANHSVALCNAFSRKRPRRVLPAEPNGAGVVARVRGLLARAVSDAGDRVLLLSGEGLSQLDAGELGELRRFLTERGRAVSIMGYVRTPAAFMASRFQHRLLQGASGWRPEREYTSYRRRFGPFDDVFGRENVHLCRFEPRRFPDGCVVRDFCTRSGIALPAERIVRINESLSRRAVAVLYTFRRFEAAWGKEPTVQVLQGRSLRALGTERFRFAAELVQPILERNRADLDWIEARLGESLAERLEPGEPDAVASEEELLRLGVESMQVLRPLLEEPDDLSFDSTPEGVARLVLRLHEERRERLHMGRPSRRGAAPSAQSGTET